jgi:hypothetical protein
VLAEFMIIIRIRVKKGRLLIRGIPNQQPSEK